MLQLFEVADVPFNRIWHEEKIGQVTDKRIPYCALRRLGLRETYASQYISKFDSPFTCFLYLEIVMNSGEDEHTSNPDWGDWADRIGRRVVVGDSRGFVWSERHDTEAKAMIAFAEYDRQMMGEREDDEEE